MINIYTCSNCEEEYCAECNPYLICDNCGEPFCEQCNSNLNSNKISLYDKLHSICTKCANKLKENKIKKSKKDTNKIKSIKQKDSFLNKILKERINQDE